MVEDYAHAGIGLRLTDLRERVYCTQMLAGSEAYKVVRLVYQISR